MTKRYLIGAAGVVGVLVAFLVEERVRGHLGLKAWERSMRARGERLTLAELAPPITNVGVRVLTPSQFQAMLIQSAATEPSVERRNLTPGVEVVLWRLREWETQSGVTNNWARFAAEFQATRERLADLRAALINEPWTVAVPYEAGFVGLLPHLAPLKGTAQSLRRATLLALHEHAFPEAVDHLRTAAALIERQQAEGLIVSQLVQIACAELSLGGSLWQALQADGWDDAQLEAIQDAWEKPRFLAAMARALQIERAMAAPYFQGGKGTAGDLAASFAWSGAPVPGIGPTGGEGMFQEWLGPILERGQGLRRAAFLSLWKFAWAGQDQLFHHRAIQQAVEATRAAATARDVTELRGAGEAVQGGRFKVFEPFTEEHLDRFARARHWFSLTVLGALDPALEKAAQTECRREMGVAAVALKRYRLRHGQWPDSLEALVPTFLSEVPRDWMNGQPLRYHRNSDDTFTLYSVGLDGSDDGGDPTPRRGPGRTVFHGRDMVWETPAREAEVGVGKASANRR